MKTRAVNIAIIVVSILLALSLLALGSTLFYNFVLLENKAPETVVVPQNYIKALSGQNEPSESIVEPETEEDTTLPEWVASRLEDRESVVDVLGTQTEQIVSEQTSELETEAAEAVLNYSEAITEAVVSEASEPEDNAGHSYEIKASSVTEPRKKLVADNRAPSSAGASSQTGNSGEPVATVVRLSYHSPDINQRFNVKNMFPGDSETKYYCARVQFINKATLYFEANVRPGYKKLAEVLKIRVLQINDNKVLYEGLIGDVPEIEAIELKGKGKTTTDVFYEITVSLDTSIGNEYMQKELLADFHWWIVTESGGGGGEGGGGGGGGVPDKPDFPGPIIGPAETDDEDETTSESSKDTDSEKESDTVSESDTRKDDTTESDTTESDTSESDNREDETGEDDTSAGDSGDVTDDGEDISDESLSDAEISQSNDAGTDTVDTEDITEVTTGDGSDDYDPDGPPASQTGDENIVRIRIAAFAALSALWLLLLLLLVRLKENKDEQKEN